MSSATVLLPPCYHQPLLHYLLLHSLGKKVIYQNVEFVIQHIYYNIYELHNNTLKLYRTYIVSIPYLHIHLIQIWVPYTFNIFYTDHKLRNSREKCTLCTTYLWPKKVLQDFWEDSFNPILLHPDVHFALFLNNFGLNRANNKSQPIIETCNTFTFVNTNYLDVQTEQHY